MIYYLYKRGGSSMSSKEFKELEKYGRVTLYAAPKERRDLLKKLMAHTQAGKTTVQQHTL